VSEEDIDLLKRFGGQCILGQNISQVFALITGDAGSGKSTFVNLIEELVGKENRVELRLEHMTGRFELSRLFGKTLLAAKDVNSGFLSSPGAKKLKALTGGDAMTLEYKNSNQALDVVGEANVIVTSNSQLRLNFDGDIDAWRRRAIWIEFRKGKEPRLVIPKFYELLLKEEGSGILNWFLDGAAELLQNDGVMERSPMQIAKIDRLIKSSIPEETVVRTFVKRDPDGSVSSKELLDFFRLVSNKMGWPILSERKRQQNLKEAMMKVHEISASSNLRRRNRSVRGYRFCKLLTLDSLKQ
jgi:energy-coupling factor transporter ATP-binding protein EcfA2